MTTRPLLPLLMLLLAGCYPPAPEVDGGVELPSDAGLPPGKAVGELCRAASECQSRHCGTGNCEDYPRCKPLDAGSSPNFCVGFEDCLAGQSCVTDRLCPSGNVRRCVTLRPEGMGCLEDAECQSRLCLSRSCEDAQTVCKVRPGACLPVDAQCKSDAECCSGLKCRSNTAVCANSWMRTCVP